MMMKKFMAVMSAAAITAAALTGCGSGSQGTSGGGKEAANVPTEPFGDTIKYDPSVAINDGKDISIELWEWGSDELFQQVIDGYCAIHPNVSIKLVNNPWEDY